MQKSHLLARTVATLLLGASAAALAQPPAGSGLSDQELDMLRGGFVTAGGLHIDFSLRSMVLVNGEAVMQSVIGPSAAGLPQLQQLSQSAIAGAGTLVLSSGLHTLIQNDLDNQTIQSFKVLDVQVANLANLRGMEIRNRVDRGIVESLR